jgi:nicotinamidase-related amidase
MRFPNSLLCGGVALLVAGIAALGSLAATSPVLHLKLRTRVEPFKGSGDWREVTVEEQLPTSATALILCDMWDNHWCQGAARRVEPLAQKAAPVIDLARERGILIIHAPSETMPYYKDAPQRLSVLSIPLAATPTPLALTDPPLPIDDSDGGCDTPNNPLPVNYRAWTRQHAAIRIAPSDLISDNGREVYSALQLRGIQNLLVAGVHANMCILNRSFAIRQMTKWGVRCILIRDLTDAMYNPAKRPFVTHEQGTQLVIEHIEKYWAPTVTSAELTRALKEN